MPSSGWDSFGDRVGSGPGERSVGRRDRGASGASFSVIIRGKSHGIAQAKNIAGNPGLELRPAEQTGEKPVVASVGVLRRMDAGSSRGGMRKRRHRGVGSAGLADEPGEQVADDRRGAGGQEP